MPTAGRRCPSANSKNRSRNAKRELHGSAMPDRRTVSAVAHLSSAVARLDDTPRLNSRADRTGPMLLQARRESSLSLAMRSNISLTDFILYSCSSPSRGSSRRILYSRDDAGRDARTGWNSTSWPTLNFEFSNFFLLSRWAPSAKQRSEFLRSAASARKVSTGLKRPIRRTRSPPSSHVFEFKHAFLNSRPLR
jgi:hypothetical protein